MQRFSRLTAHRHTARVRAITNTNTTGTIHQHQKRGPRRWSAVLLGAVIAVASASASPVGDSDGESLAVQGHAKRYMRINEYLFHGTQKTTAIAQRIDSAHRHQV